MLKFLAVILITNSHFDLIYGRFGALATGGAIGDVLFFFCSGFTLFLGRTGRFDNWYRRRISRIYPSVMGWALITALLFGSKRSFGDVVLYGGGAFVSAIMIYYVVLYFVKRYMMNHLNIAFALCCVYVIVWYVSFFENKEINHLYKAVQYYHYILFMLLGAIAGVRYKQEEVLKAGCSRGFLAKHALLLLVHLILFYGIQIAETRFIWIARLQIITLLPLMGIVHELWMLMHSESLLRICQKPKVAFVVAFVSGLCLDIYISQMTLLGFYNNSLMTGGWAQSIQALFPLNVFIAIVVILFSAYLLRSTGRWFVQTFGGEDYSWKEILKLT